MCNLLERLYSFGYNSALYPGKAPIAQTPPPGTEDHWRQGWPWGGGGDVIDFKLIGL